MSKNRTGLYLGLAAAGAGGYYLYRAGGDINNARSKFKLDERIPELAQDGKDKLDGIRQDARDKIDQVDRTVEQKAAEAKGNVSGWFGGKK
ncbi:hypothetical protein N7509_008643 [Penicillium cosmopolitanum]|uniref:YtxH domain-containing protein n=1 Tax=Penicillium cosmopolitanum TaxID=1131564 RepID=A0A9W9VMZ6_9EURO|nr:uncharacterized protein N7509_008643 [Penicillium cosmopolitanum]KAJ5386102.1 hypothetical protein N7509_008643 [Penicillium cosmopolitanum]